MHKAFAGLRAEEAIEDVLKLFVRTKDNKEFVNTAKKMFVKK